MKCARKVHAQMNAGLGTNLNENASAELSGKGASSSERSADNGETENESAEMAAEEEVLNLWAANTGGNSRSETENVRGTR